MIRLARNPNVDGTAVDEDLYLIDIEADEVYYLDRITKGIWNLLNEPRTREQVCQAYVAAFPEENRENISRDIRRTLDDMLDRGLIVPL